MLRPSVCRPSSVVRRPSVTRATAYTVSARIAKFGQIMPLGNISRRFFLFLKIFIFEIFTNILRFSHNGSLWE